MNACLFTGLIAVVLCSACGEKNGGNDTPTPPVVGRSVQQWVTTKDAAQTLTAGAAFSFATPAARTLPTITIDSTQVFQTVDGFGYTLTSGSAQLLYAMPAAARATLLQELFTTAGNGIGISYIRISIGASDLSSSVYTYNDLSAGSTDVPQANFNLLPDRASLIPLLKEIIALQPGIKILGTPWTAPVWMKSNNNSVGGSLLPAYYASYAIYLVKYIQAMKAEGITIDAITPQNEPLNAGNNPSMVMTAAEQAAFIKNNLGPALAAASLSTKIITYDHNADRPDYPLAILNDAAAKPFVNGSAFHLYAGDISALTTVRNAHPDKAIYFTEQFTSSTGDFGGDLRWHLKNVIIGSMRNWSRNALEWNLASDASWNPHTPGGCNTCKGALTITGSNVQRNVSYYIVSHASRFVPPGSVRIGSNIMGPLQNVVFHTPAGKYVLIVINDSDARSEFKIEMGSLQAITTLEAGAAGTYMW